MTNDFWKRLVIRAEEVFCRPTALYSWDDIIRGAKVFGHRKAQRAVSANTWRSHHRKDTSRVGSSEAYEAFFMSNKVRLLSKLREIRKGYELHSFENEIVSQIKATLTNTENYVLASYNSLRKPVDLYVEHLVAMAEEIDLATRCSLIPLLYLPIDSQVLDAFALPDGSSYSLFTREELRSNGLRPGSSYGQVATEKVYAELSGCISRRGAEASAASGLQFYPIYFDMLWNKRFERPGRNLFETNP